MKRLILCCDGTWNTVDQKHDGKLVPTNVVKLAVRTAKRTPDGTLQLLYYDQGIGTGNTLDRWTGGAFGEGLEANIHDAYRFLVANYEPADEIFLFGFSRGAYTARSIAGMIRKAGILRRARVNLYPEARALYRSLEHPDKEGPRAFRAANSLLERTPIQCVAVFDTVGALGIPLRGLRSLTQADHQFHDTQLSSSVKHAYHALALDEHRAPFEPTLWSSTPTPNQVIEQVWFAGAHSDVGGGYPETQLSDTALKWIMSRAQRAGLSFDEQVLAAFELQPLPTGTLHNSKDGLYRATRGIDRQLKGTPTEYLHRSVIERYDQDQKYRPPSLQPVEPGLARYRERFTNTPDDIQPL